MLYEFALTPDVFDGAMMTAQPKFGPELSTILRELRDNGLVADLYRGKWSQQIMPRIATLPNPVREAVTKHLGILRGRNRIVRRPITQDSIPRTDSEWLAEGLRSHQLVPFHGLVTTQTWDDPANAVPLVALGDVTESDLWNNRRRSLTVQRTLIDYQSLLTPILRFARVVYIIDPHLTCLEPHVRRFFPVVEICARLLGTRASAPITGDIEIHCKDKGEPVSSLQLEWEQRLGRLRRQLPEQQRHRFKVFVWRERAGGELFHDRHLITDQCGLNLPYGFDVAPHSVAPGTTTWSMMDWEDIEPNLRKFRATTSPYDSVGQSEITS